MKLPLGEPNRARSGVRPTTTSIETGQDRVGDYQAQQRDPAPRGFDYLYGHVVVRLEVHSVQVGDTTNVAIHVTLEIGLEPAGGQSQSAALR